MCLSVRAPFRVATNRDLGGCRSSSLVYTSSCADATPVLMCRSSAKRHLHGPCPNELDSRPDRNPGGSSPLGWLLFHSKTRPWMTPATFSLSLNTAAVTNSLQNNMYPLQASDRADASVSSRAWCAWHCKGIIVGKGNIVRWTYSQFTKRI